MNSMFPRHTFMRSVLSSESRPAIPRLNAEARLTGASPRRAVATVGATVLGLVLLFTFKTPDAPPAPIRRTAAASAQSPTNGGQQVEGDVIATQFGDIQVRLVESGGTIVDVQALQLPFDRRRSLEISQFVEPILLQRGPPGPERTDRHSSREPPTPARPTASRSSRHSIARTADARSASPGSRNWLHERHSPGSRNARESEARLLFDGGCHRITPRWQFERSRFVVRHDVSLFRWPRRPGAS